jgi:hypothetical protein
MPRIENTAEGARGFTVKVGDGAVTVLVPGRSESRVNGSAVVDQTVLDQAVKDPFVKALIDNGDLVVAKGSKAPEPAPADDKKK